MANDIDAGECESTCRAKTSSRAAEANKLPVTRWLSLATLAITPLRCVHIRPATASICIYFRCTAPSFTRRRHAARQKYLSYLPESLQRRKLLLCATSRPERVQQDLLKDLVGAGEQRRRNSEGIARDMAGRMIGPVSTTKTKPSTNVQSGRQTAGGHGILRAWARTSGLKPGQIEDIDKCNEGIACSDRRCDGMRAQGCA